MNRIQSANHRLPMKFIVRFILFVLLLGYLSTGIAQIRPEERAVVRRFGRVVARPGPGLWVGFPVGIDQIDRIGVLTVRQLDVGYNPEIPDDTATTPPGQLLTGDQNLVNIKLVVEYAVDERESGIDQYLALRDRLDAVLSRTLESFAAAWVEGRTVDDALLAGRTELPRWLMTQLPEALSAQRLGIVVQRISVDYLAAPAEVRDAFERVNQAQTAIQTQEFQARQQAAQRLREAEAMKFRLEQQTESYRRERESLARADATAFLKRLEQYRQLRQQNPAILSAIWWDEMGKVLVDMKNRGRIDLMDQYLGKDGLDITQFVPTKKR